MSLLLKIVFLSFCLSKYKEGDGLPTQFAALTTSYRGCMRLFLLLCFGKVTTGDSCAQQDGQSMGTGMFHWVLSCASTQAALLLPPIAAAAIQHTGFSTSWPLWPQQPFFFPHTVCIQHTAPSWAALWIPSTYVIVYEELPLWPGELIHRSLPALRGIGCRTVMIWELHGGHLCFCHPSGFEILVFFFPLMSGDVLSSSSFPFRAITIYFIFKQQPVAINFRKFLPTLY